MGHNRRKAVQNSREEAPLHYTVVSLFAGCGGMDLGFLGDFRYHGHHFQNLAFQVLAAYDHDPKCVTTYRNNIGAHIHEADLSHFDRVAVPPADVLIGGFPCQDFSSCGPKKGLSSKRGQLYQVLRRYMNKYSPRVVVGENVPHLARMSSGSVLNTIHEDLEGDDYHFVIWTLYAPDYGIPQRRTRLFLVGVHNDISGFPEKPPKTHTEDNYLSIDWAIKDLVTVSDESIPNQSQYFLASKAKRGNGQGDEKNHSGSPAYTIRANAKSRVQFHYSLPRRLTVRECARLQTFPDSFAFPHSATTNIMQIGNAVPPILAYHVARAIERFLKQIPDSKTAKRGAK
ncbi:MAG: DNA (cytosine-5-)-methyltransferase [Chlamydiota bacterium]